MHTGVWLESQKERELLENLRPVGEDFIKLDLKEAGWEVVDWIHLNRDKEGMAFSGSINAANFLITRRLSQKGLCFMVLDGTEESDL